MCSHAILSGYDMQQDIIQNLPLLKHLLYGIETVLSGGLHPIIGHRAYILRSYIGDLYVLYYEHIEPIYG